MITVSLKQILAKNPCSDGWAKVLHAREKITKEQLESCIKDEHTPISYSKLADDEQFPISSIIDSNSLYDCLWALRCVDDQHYPLMRKFAVWCARQVQHLMKDQRSVDALDVAWQHSQGIATDQELDAAWAAARAAEWAAAWAAARDAGWDAERAAEWAAARDAALDAARDAQAKKLKEILDSGHWVE